VLQKFYTHQGSSIGRLTSTYLYMKTLDKNWLTEGLIDFEYKKYLVLAYLQDVKQHFNQKKLYPYLSDLVLHYQNLLSIKENKKLIYENFPKKISKADFEKLTLSYSKIIEDDVFMAELEEIIGYSIPRFKEMLQQGKDIYEWVEEHIHITPIGLSPLYHVEGYLFLSESHVRETRIYQYQITIFENAHEKYRGVHTTFLESYRRGIGVTFENIKIDLIKRYSQMPNPATYLVESKIVCPLDETLLPIAKRLLVKHISLS
jgi:hypothetical protein